MPIVIVAFLILMGCSSHRPTYAFPPNVSEAGPATLISGVDVFTGLDPFLTKQMDVLIVDGKIRAIVPTGNHRLEGKVQEVDGRGKVLLPGLVDMHILLGASSSGDPRVQLEWLLSQGITTAVVAGHETDVEGLQRQIASGRLAGPRLYRSTRSIRGDENAQASLYRLKSVQETKGPRDAARAARRDLERLRSDFVRVDWSKGFSTASATAVVAEARAYEKPVYAASSSSEGAAMAAEAGVMLLLAPPWADRLNKEQAHRIALTGIPVVTTLGLCPPAREACTEIMRDNVVRMMEAGVPLLGGSGTGAGPELRPLSRELRELVDLGISPVDALLSVTSHPVRLLDPTAKFGVVSPGAYADLVLVDGNPLEDITSLERVVKVWQGGRLVERL